MVVTKQRWFIAPNRNHADMLRQQLPDGVEAFYTKSTTKISFISFVQQACKRIGGRDYYSQAAVREDIVEQSPVFIHGYG